MGVRVWGLGFSFFFLGLGSTSGMMPSRSMRSWGGLRFRVQGAGVRVQGSGCRVQGAGFRVQATAVGGGEAGRCGEARLGVSV